MYNLSVVIRGVATFLYCMFEKGKLPCNKSGRFVFLSPNILLGSSWDVFWSNLFFSRPFPSPFERVTRGSQTDVWFLGVSLSQS